MDWVVYSNACSQTELFDESNNLVRKEGEVIPQSNTHQTYVFIIQ